MPITPDWIYDIEPPVDAEYRNEFFRLLETMVAYNTEALDGASLAQQGETLAHIEEWSKEWLKQQGKLRFKNEKADWKPFVSRDGLREVDHFAAYVVAWMVATSPALMAAVETNPQMLRGLLEIYIRAFRDGYSHSNWLNRGDAKQWESTPRPRARRVPDAFREAFAGEDDWHLQLH